MGNGKKEHGLTEKQQRFCLEYMIDMNGTQAALRAGYSEKTAAKQAPQLLAKTSIQDKISELKTIQQKKTTKTIDHVIDEYEKIAFSNITDMYDDWFSIKDFKEIPKEIKAAISEIQTRVITTRDLGGGEVKDEQVKIKLHDKIKALTQLEKYKTNDNKSEKINVNIEFTDSPSLNDLEGFEYEDSEQV